MVVVTCGSDEGEQPTENSFLLRDSNLGPVHEFPSAIDGAEPLH